MKTSRFIAPLGILFLGPLGPLIPLTTAPAADLRQSATRQEQIRSETRQLVTRLDDFLAEYARNGIAQGEDYDSLKKVRAQLGSLSDDEMERVAALLNQPETDGKPQIERMAKAYAGEKDISLQLKQILAAHERQLDIAALAAALRQLADRQSANLSTAIDARQLAAQDKSANGQAAVAASEEAQQGEQGAIAGEVKLTADKLGRLAAGGGDAKCQDAMTRLGQTQPQAAAAADALGAGKVDDAVTAETTVREQLEEIARALAPANKQDDLSNGQAGQLADIAQAQRTLLDQTRRLTAGLKKLADAQTPAEADKAMLAQLKVGAVARQLAPSGITPASAPDQIRNAPAMQKFLTARSDALKKQEDTLRPQLSALAAGQAALAAKAQMLREDLQKTARDAAIPMANALADMNSAQNALAQTQGEQATQNETNAVSQLDQAAKLAEQSEAQSSQNSQTAQAQPNEGAAQQLAQLQNGVHDLTAKETAAMQMGDALKTGSMAAVAAVLQASMAGKAQALQQAAAQQGSPAAQPLQQAADALQNAAQAMQSGGMAKPAIEAQQAALQSLGQAAQQLAQQAAEAAQQKQELANIERQMDSLGRVIQAQKQLDSETAKAAENENAAKAKALGRQQANVRKDAENLRQAMNTATPSGTPDAAEAIDHADTAMGDAAQKLSEGGEQEAQPPQQDALAALYKAQDALADRMQTLDAGQPPASAQALANAEAQLGKAQQETASAQEAMAPGQNANNTTAANNPGNSSNAHPSNAANAAGPEMKRAAGQLGEAAQTVAQAEAHPEAMPQDARDAIRSAEQALAGAAEAAAGGENQQARTQAGQGQQAMQAAQSALQEAQVGIAALAPGSAEDAQTGAQSSQPSGQSPQGDQLPTGQNAPTGKNGKSASEKNWNDQAGAAQAALAGAHGAGRFVALPERDRAAVQQSQSEKYPQEYGSMIEEYMRNLATDAGAK